MDLLQYIALQIEAEELIGSKEELVAEDITPILDWLEDRGVDFSSIANETSHSLDNDAAAVQETE